MQLSDAAWPIDLSRAPSIQQIGVGIHGQKSIERYQMLGFWCIHSYRYRGDLRINQNWYEIHPGCVSILPPDADLEYRYRGRSEHAYAHFSLPTTQEAAQRLPPMQQPGQRFAEFDQAFRETIVWQATRPERARARLWDLLWQLTDAAVPPTGAAAHAHPAVLAAMHRIELRLAEPIRIAALAEECDVSHNHLIRLFRAATGKSIAQYIRHRRVTQAEHLLHHTTLPIKAIARQVGIADLHLFNKTLRRATGRSPRAAREGSQ